MTEKHNYAEDRRTRLEELNVALHDLLLARQRMVDTTERQRKILNDAKADIGTARSQLRTAEQAYERTRDRLMALIPQLAGHEALVESATALLEEHAVR